MESKFECQEISSDHEDISVPKLSTREQEEVLQVCSIDIEGMLDLEQIRCHLYQHKLLSDSECSTLQASDFELSRKTKIQMLITKLPRKGSDALDRFVKCLTNSTNGTGHGELAQLICKTVGGRENQTLSSGARHKRRITVRCCCKSLVCAVSAIALICFLVCVIFPIIVYYFNLIHSKSLPYLSNNFVGREKEMNEVSKLLDFGNSEIRIVNIHGSPGFGKSTLAIHVGHKMVKGGVTVDYVNMNDLPDKDIKTALAEKILEASDIESSNVTFERLLRWARECSSRTLLILDNCDDLLHKKKEEFQQAIIKIVEQSENNIKIILTSRKVAVFLKYIEYFKIEELSTAASFQLLESKLSSRVIISMEEKEQIATLTGNVPLALHIIGSILHLPSSPSPADLINELKEELIETLSPPDLPASEQIFTTISLSYKYLPKKLRRIGRQLTVFPGSFKIQAAFAVCNGSTVTRFSDQFISLESTKEFSDHLKSLVRNALLEHSPRTDRYQYHQLIKEFFIFIQRRHWPNEVVKCLPAFHIYYSTQLMIKSIEYQSDQSLTFLDSEQHNLEHLFTHLDQMRSISVNKLDIQAFLMTALALSSAVDAHFLQLRFSLDKCCMLLNVALHKLDGEMPHLQYYLRDQPFEVERVLQCYLTIIKQVAECEIESHGVENAILVYTNRKSIIEVKSTDMMYINFYEELRRLYLHLGIRFIKDALECQRLITNRGLTHRISCQPEQCQYYDFGIAYQSMGQYQEASTFFEEELKGSNNVLHQVRILVQLIYLYSYMNKYDERHSTIARLHKLYPDVATAPIDQLINASDAIVMFIQFYKVGGLFDEAQSLEDRFLTGLLDLKSKVITAFLTKQTTEHQRSLLQAICKALDNFFEAGNYSKIIEVGTPLIELINSSNSFSDAKIKLHLLLGMAKYRLGQHSDGMDYIEFALQSIPSPGFDDNYQKERATACWYLVHRLKYLDTCYWITWILGNVVVGVPLGITVVAVGFGVYVVLTLVPLDIFEKSIHKMGKMPVLTHDQLFSSTALTTRTDNLELFNSKWLNIIFQPLLKAVLSVTRATVIMELRLSFMKCASSLSYLTLCILWVWIKLTYAYIAYLRIRWFRDPAKSRQAMYYFSHYSFYPFAVVHLLSTFKHCEKVLCVKETLRKIRDPRFRYGGDRTPHSLFINYI
jgi:tetratricopeptide (TPR) repeat protein